MASVDEPLFREGEGPLLPWLRGELRRAVEDIHHPSVVQFIAFLLERAALEPPAAALRTALLDRTLGPLRRALERAEGTGELHAVPNVDDLLAMLLGPLMFRVVHAGGVADEAFIDHVITTALSQWTPDVQAMTARRSASMGSQRR